MNPDNLEPANQQPISPAPTGQPQTVVPQEPTVFAQPQPESLPNPPATEGAPTPLAPNIMTPPTQDQVSPKQSGGKKVVILVAAVMAAILMAGAAYFLINKSKDDKPNYSDDSVVIDETPLAEEDQEAEARPSKTETPVNASVKTDTGFTVSVSSIVRNFPSEQADKDDEIILLAMKIESDGTYTGTPSPTDMDVATNDGKKFSKTYSVTDKDITAGGYTPLPSTSAKAGSPISGYVAFAIPYKSDLAKFIYTRPTTKILGGETLPEKSFEAAL